MLGAVTNEHEDTVSCRFILTPLCPDSLWRCPLVGREHHRAVLCVSLLFRPR
jgi:hypothetical protein